MCKNLLLLLSLSASIAMGADKCLVEWIFKTEADVAAWTAKTNHVSEVTLSEEGIRGTLLDWDPWLTSPEFDIRAKPWQYIEVVAKTDADGGGSIYYTDTNDTQYDGFSPKINVGLRFHGDGQWQTYKILPNWSQRKIIKIRLDFPGVHGDDKGKKSFVVKSVRIMEADYESTPATAPRWDFRNGTAAWRAAADSSLSPSADGLRVSCGSPESRPSISSGPINIDSFEHGTWLSITMAARAGREVHMEWISSLLGKNSYRFPIIADDQYHMYNVDLSGCRGWIDRIYELTFILSDVPGASVAIKELSIASDPQGPAQLSIKDSGLIDALNRTNRPCEFSYTVLNTGGDTAKNAHVSRLQLPEGVSVVETDSAWLRLPPLVPFDPVTRSLRLQASKAVTGEYELVISYGDKQSSQRGELIFTPNLNLPKADYVPEPIPVKSDYEVGALYFPGWERYEKWERIWRVDPTRKPVLGWYDESNPEVVDWQIKWLVENGIQYLLVDWYWDRGKIRLDHWLRAFQKARYRSHMKWAMMWANHNGKGSHSIADQIKATQYWVDNYFNTPEYYCIDGKPVVMIWSQRGMETDMEGQGGIKALLAASQQVAKEAGYSGIHFSVMKWPEHEVDPKHIQWLKDQGMHSTSIYHYMHHGGRADNPRNFSFEHVAATNKDLWEKWYEVGILPFFTNISTGWHDRPWNNRTFIYGRTPALFKQICEDAKAFADRTGLKKRILLSPINEWGEGSYIEPNREYGFAMYEAVRDTFAQKPLRGWPKNYGPSDVGLGPYDYPKPDRSHLTRTNWDFADNKAQGWRAAMGISDWQVENGQLAFNTTTRDPAMSINLNRMDTRQFKRMTVRIKATPEADAQDKKDTLQLFWSTTTAPISEPLSICKDYNANDEFVDLVLNLGDHRLWRGKLTSLRLDPLSRKGAKITIDSIKLE
jgi:hypothetical protein